MQKTAILILAAGTSSRMGKPKQLLPYKHATLLGLTIENAKKTNADNVFCVLGANAEVIENSISEYAIETIFNPDFKEGLSTSIITGINYLAFKNFDSVLIMLADQPKITAIYLNKLLELSLVNPEKIIASKYNSNNGVPAVFPKKYFNKLLELKGDQGAKKILESLKSEVIAVDIINLLDIDNEIDYKELLKNK